MKGLVRFCLLLMLITQATGAFSQDQAAILADEARRTNSKHRIAVLDRLGALGEKAVDALAGLILEDTDRHLSFEAMQEIIRIKSPRVLPVLIKRLKVALPHHRPELAGRKPIVDHTESDISTVLYAIGNHQNPKAFPVLRHHIKHKTAFVRLAAVSALGSIGVPEGIPLLEKMLSDKDASIRWQAKKSIENIRAMQAKYPKRLTTRNWWDG